MTSDGWTGAVRRRLGLGRLLPLGGPRDGAWLTEAAAEAVLRRAARNVTGVRLGVLRLELADPDGPFEPAVPAPPSALPPGPLRVTAECAAAAYEPLPTTTARLRSALATTATQRLGLVVSEIDLRVTELLDTEPESAAGTGARPDAEAGTGAGARPDMATGTETGAGPGPGRQPRPGVTPASVPAPGGADLAGDEALAAAAALAVPGVTGTSGVLGRAVRLEERHDSTAALPRRHVQLEITAAATPRTLDVALAVRTAVSAALPDRPTVTVLVTAVD
ncbi:nucleopolyhedrovirus P10 family protein [Streptomyces sp. NBC_00199]|uniref:nucleopolyhedrovirus P10 family protein n=1 Tax=Streptomyces sp. NBC_00199 TaxID=2975678 RepID=UPI00224ED413|nr:nucleopolyhedrovirus P10 family protein [Streptomyces sp. NBC_00199]MCX5268834.1 nucleopolyhedrovirus P10 family protein [Streptomyces sp. NBC_00199]